MSKKQETAIGKRLPDGTWECVECGRVCQTHGGLNLHYAWKHSDKFVGSPRNNGTKGKGCSHRWVRLSEQEQSQAEAIKAGWEYFCEACKELGKRGGSGILTEEELS